MRRLSIHIAVSVVCGSLKALRGVLEHLAASNIQDSDRTKGLLTAVGQFHLVVVCFKKENVLMRVVLLSKYFQRVDLDLYTATTMVTADKEAVSEKQSALTQQKKQSSAL